MTAPRVVDAIAAVALVLEQEKPHYSRREILGGIEGMATDPKEWWVIVIARTHDEEWMLYGCWPEAEQGPNQYDYVAQGHVVRDLGNALSYGDALLNALGHATGILE